MSGAPRRRTFEQRLKDLENLVGQFQRAARLRSASISGGGGLTIKDDGTIKTLYSSGEIAVLLGDLSDEFAHLTTGFLILKDEPGLSKAIFSVYEVTAGAGDYSIQGDNIDSFVVNLGGPGASKFFSMVIPTKAGIIGVDNNLTLNGNVSVSTNLELASPPTSAAAANVRYDTGDKRIKHITSSERFKQDIEDAEVDPLALLRVRGVTWRDKQEVVKDSDVTTRYVGFTAEAFHEAGLTDFVEYDDEGLPFALQYDRISVALLELDRYQQTRIDGLEQRHRQQEQKINELEGRLAALEVALAEKEA